ncbi:MAG: hypothetical protein FWG09_01575 [Synergistaceae bacterium]|nr:hypothetical protein [Synergistaceae bacterium]
MNVKRWNFFACLFLLVLLLAGTSQSAAQEWVDLGGLKIPAAWSTSPLEEGPGGVNITGAGAGGPIEMFFGEGFDCPIDMLLEESVSWQEFAFGDDQGGYMAEFPESIIWVRKSYANVTLYHNGDKSVFTDNEDLILSVVRTLTD